VEEPREGVTVAGTGDGRGRASGAGSGRARVKGKDRRERGKRKPRRGLVTGPAAPFGVARHCRAKISDAAAPATSAGQGPDRCQVTPSAAPPYMARQHCLAAS